MFHPKRDEIDSRVTENPASKSFHFQFYDLITGEPEQEIKTNRILSL